MASSLISNNGSVAQHETNILTNTPGRVRVLVEDELDVPVWNKILTRFCSDRSFEITPYSYTPGVHGKGKAKILSLAADFGPDCIACVDSDYDWLLEQWTQAGQVICGSPYILQTYAYSIENLASQPGGKSDCMLESTLHCSQEQQDLDKSLETFIKEISKALYEPLLWHLIMQKEQTDLDKITPGWDYILNNNHYAAILNSTGDPIPRKRTGMLELMRQRAADLVLDYEMRYPHLITPRQNLRIYLTGHYGLSSENAYLFVRGHNLHDFLLQNFYRPIFRADIKSHTEDIRNNTVGADTASAINHYKAMTVPFERIYIHRTDYLSDPANPLTQRMQGAISEIFPPLHP